MLRCPLYIYIYRYPQLGSLQKKTKIVLKNPQTLTKQFWLTFFCCGYYYWVKPPATPNRELTGEVSIFRGTARTFAHNIDFCLHKFEIINETALRGLCSCDTFGGWTHTTIPKKKGFISLMYVFWHIVVWCARKLVRDV